MDNYAGILYAVDQSVARVTLNRPEKRNALNDEVIRELREALKAASSDSDVRVVLLSGAGKDFCSGADLAALQRSSQATIMENLSSARNLAELVVEIRRHPLPIIAAVRGRALAGGCGLATACDVILASESAQFGYPEINIGFVPAIVMAILRRSVSEKRAFELITAGEPVPARVAVEIGLINRVYSDADFESDVDKYVTSIAAKSGSGLTLCKNLLYHMDNMSFEAAVEAGVHVNVIARNTEDFSREIERFLRKG